MAVAKTEKTTKATLRVEVATDTFKNRIFNNVNPALTDAQFYSLFGTSTSSMASLTSDSLDKLTRTDTAVIVDQ